jgi:Ca2+/Na+ antiporter
VILILLGTFLLFIGIYITQNVSPFSETKMLSYASEQGFLTDNELLLSIDSMIDRGIIFRMMEGKNVFVFLLVWSSMFISYFAAVHMALDKFFFRKFYQSANIAAAYRRGIFIVAVFIGFIFLRLIDSFYWYNALALILLALFLEIFISGLLKEKHAQS